MRSISLASLLFWLLTLPDVHSAEPSSKNAVFRGKTLMQWRGELLSAEPRVRRRAATALGLGRFGKEAVSALIDAQRDSDETVSRAALMALWNLGSDAADAAGLLAQHVPLIDEYRFRTFSTNPVPLGPAIVPHLFRRLRDYDDTVITRKISSQLLNGLDRSCLPLLLAGLEDGSVFGRRAAVNALGQLGSEAAEAEPKLLALLNDRSTELRSETTEALAHIGAGAGTIAVLSARLRLGDDDGNSGTALARLGQPGIAALRQVYHGAGPDSRASILMQIRDEGKDVLPLLMAGLRDSSVDVRQTAAQALCCFSAVLDPVLPQMIEALEDRDSLVRVSVASAIGQILPPRREAVFALVKHFDDNDLMVQLMASTKLIQWGRHARCAIPLLLEALEYRHDFAGSLAAGVLGAIGTGRPDVVLALTAALKDPSEDVRKSAAYALERLGPEVRQARAQTAVSPASKEQGALLTETVFQALRTCLRDRSTHVRLAAASALVCLGDRSKELAFQLGIEALDPFGWVLEQSNKVGRNMAVEALARMGKDAAPALLPLLLMLYQGDVDFSRKVLETVKAMGRAARPAVPVLRGILLTASPSELWASATETLAGLGTEGHAALRECFSRCNGPLHLAMFIGLKDSGSAVKELLPDVFRLVRDSEGNWNWAALMLLPHAGNRDACRVLMSALDSEDFGIFEVACAGLGAIGKEAHAAIPSLTGFLLEPRPETRRAAIEALGRIGPDEKIALPALIETLTDPDGRVRKAGAVTLGSMGTEGAASLPALRAACADRSESVCLAVACAMARIGASRGEASRVLRSVLFDGKDGTARVEAALALWQHEKAHDIVPSLVRLLCDPQARTAAEEALGTLDELKGEARAFLRPLLLHEEREVRAAAWRILDKIAPDVTALLLTP